MFRRLLPFTDSEELSLLVVEIYWRLGTCLSRGRGGGTGGVWGTGMGGGGGGGGGVGGGGGGGAQLCQRKAVVYKAPRCDWSIGAACTSKPPDAASSDGRLW